MNWHFKKNGEKDGIVEVGYSFEENETCDGIIMYEKATCHPTIEKISKDSDLFDAQRGCQFIHRLVRENKLSDKVFNVRTG